MKKLLLSGTLALFAAASYAQNSATVVQNGTMNSASAVQSGSSLTATVSQVGATPTAVASNTGITNQTGTGHTATVNQNGGSTFNRAYATQKNGTSGPGSNSATLSQSNGSGGTVARGGDRMTNTVADAGNFSGTFQTGSNNNATVNQDGTGTQGNLGEIIQQGNTNTGTVTQSQAAKNGVAMIFQGVEPAPVVDVMGNNATINQDISTRAFAITKQLSNGNIANVDQSGVNSLDNKSYITQGDGTNVTGQAGNFALVSQNGGSGGLSSGNSATVTQTSNGDQTTIRQSNGSQDNIAFVNQVSGTGSDARIDQLYTSSSNKASITMYGDFHGSLISQQSASSNNEATVTQGNASSASDHGVAYIYQVTGASSGTATINQNQTTGGSYNSAQIVQTGSSGTTVGNLATLTQEDSYNKAGLVQTGTGSNTATFGQTGSYNVIGGPGGAGAGGIANSAVQDGFKNSMTVTQTAATGTMAAHNTAMLSQTGDMNILTVNQTVGAGAVAGNMATATQTGMNNQAIVQQTAMP